MQEVEVRWWKDWSIFHRRGWGNGDCSAWKTGKKKKMLRGISSICTNTWREGVKKMEPRSFLWCLATNTEGFPEHKEKQLYCEGDWALKEAARSGAGDSTPGEIEKPSGLCSLLYIILVEQQGFWTKWPPERSLPTSNILLSSPLPPPFYFFQKRHVKTDTKK